MTSCNEQRMRLEDMAYMKMCQGFTKTQRRKWNAILAEMWYLSDFLLDRSRFHGHSEKAERLHGLISSLPVMDLDGKGFSRSGNAIEDF